MRRQAERPPRKRKQRPTSATAAANSQLYGMTVTRGARYLLRNGLDYLSYQQYDRALKFLREAEARITEQKSRKVQKELNDAEVTRAQAGHRDRPAWLAQSIQRGDSLCPERQVSPGEWFYPSQAL